MLVTPCLPLLPTGELCAFQPFSAAAAPGGGGGQPRLVYGRVTADARPAAGQAVHRVPLEVDPVSRLQLWDDFLSVTERLSPRL